MEIARLTSEQRPNVKGRSALHVIVLSAVRPTHLHESIRDELAA